MIRKGLKNKKSIRVILAAAMVWLVLLFVIHVFAARSVADTIKLSDPALSGLDVTYTGSAGDGDETTKGEVSTKGETNSFEVTVKSGYTAATTGCSGTDAKGEDSSVVIVLKNTTTTAMTLSFSYSCSQVGGTVVVDTKAYNNVGTIENFAKTLAENEQVTISIKAPGINSGQNAVEMAVTNIQFEEYAVDVTTTFLPAEHGSYTVDGDTVIESFTETRSSKNLYRLVATPDDGYVFFGWKNTTTKAKNKYIAYESNYSAKFLENCAIQPVFAPKESAQFSVGNKVFYNLNEADAYALTQATKTIVLHTTGTMPVDEYSISSSVTLLIPYSSGTEVHQSPVTVGSASASYAYLTLTIQQGTTLTVNGAINVDGQILNNPSRPTGPYGLIKLERDAYINLENGSALYCWGYINGDGMVEAKKGSDVYECFQLTGWRGGGQTTTMIFSRHKVFPVNQYYVQNIESALKLNYASREYVYASVVVNTSDQYDVMVEFISPSAGMFRLQEDGSYIIKKYVAATDRMYFEVNGKLLISSMTLKFSSVYSLKTADSPLPINSNFTINIYSGTTTIDPNQDIALLPGAEFTVSNGAIFDVQSNMYVYDQTDWMKGKYAYKFGGGACYFAPIHYTTTNGTEPRRTIDDLKSAMVYVNGTMKITGKIYTTAAGANIFSTDDEGKIIFEQKADTGTKTTYQCQDNSSIVGITCYPAKLRNGREPYYTETAGAQAGWSYKYDTVQQRWYRFRVDYQFNGKNIGYDLITTDTATRDVSDYITEGNSLTAEVVKPTSSNIKGEFNGNILTVSGIDTNCTINIKGVAASYTPYFVLNEHQYSVYLSYGGTKITNKVTIDNKTYYVVESHETMAFGAALSAPSDEKMGVSKASHNSITWFLEDVTTGAQQFMGTVPSGTTKGKPVYIYGIYNGAVAHNSYTNEYYTNLKDAIVDLPVTGSATLTMYANCGTFEDESKTASYSLSANITFNVNGKEVWGSLVNNGTLTLDLNGGSVRYITGATAGSTSYRASAAVINNGTMTIQDSQGGGVISTDAVCDDNVRYDLKNHASAIRNLGSLAMEDIRVSVDQSVNDWVTAVMNYNGGVITSMNNCSVVCTRGYGITNYGGTIQTISDGTINGGDAATAGQYGIQNRNMRSGSKTAESPYTIAKLGTIGTISGMNINVYQFGLDNYGTVNSISGGTSIAATKDAVYNRAGWYYDTQEIITITTESGNARTIVTTYDTQNYSTIKEISGNVSIAATGGDIGLRNYGNIGTIIGNVSISATGNYGLLNNGVINSISGSNVKIKANANALYNNENNRVLTQVETRTNLGQIDKVTSGHYLTLREFERTYAEPHIGGIDGITIASTGGYGLYNQGTIDEVKNVNVTSSANAVNNSNGYYTQRKCFTLAHGEKEFGTTSYIWEANISYTRNQPKIDKLTGVTATTTSTTGALNNTGIINTIDSCTFTARKHNALSNSLCVTGYYLGDHASAYEQYKAFISEGSSYVFRATDSTSAYTRGQIGSITNTKLSSTEITSEWVAVLDNTGYIGTIGAGTTITLNGASGTPATTKDRLYAIRVSDNCYATKRTVYKDVTNAIQSLGKPVKGNYYRQDDFSYTYTDGVRAEIGDISGVTISNNYGYGVWNCGKIGSVGQDTSISAYNHAVCNSNGSYTERSTVRLTTGTTLYSEGSCVGESNCSYKTIPAEITLINGATIETIGSDGGSYFGISNSGHIGTIKNTNISAAYSSAIRNTGKTNLTYKVEYTGNGVSGINPYIVWDTSKTKYVFATSYSSTNSYSATCTPCMIDLIGEDNTLTSKNYTIYNSGIITKIDGGTSKNIVSAMGSSGVGINNYRGTNATEKVVAGSGTYTYNSATIGTIANTEVTATANALVNSDSNSNYTAVAINELGTGNMFESGKDCVVNNNNGSIARITGGTFRATSTDTYALKNNNTSAAIAISVGPTFLGGTDSRSYAIYEADTDRRQTYPEGGYTLSNKPNKDGYYYITENKFTIYYRGNGSDSDPVTGSVVDQVISLPKIKVVLQPNGFRRENWGFVGWALNENTGAGTVEKLLSGEVTLDKLGNPGAGDKVTLYAIWKPNKSHSVTVSWNSDKLLYNYQPNVYEWNAQKLCYELKTPAYWDGNHSVTITNTGEVNNTKYGKVNVGISYTNTNTSYSGFSMKYYNPDTQVEFTGTDSSNNLAKALDPGGFVKAQLKLIGDLPTDMASGTNIKIGKVTLTLTTAD